MADRDKPTPTAAEDDIRSIREQVMGRVREEEAQAPPKEDKKPEPVRHAFVLQCCKALEKGMGVLFATLMRDKFVHVPERKQWLAWRENYWEEIFPCQAGAVVERVVERLDEALGYEYSLLNGLDQDDKEGRKTHEANIDSLRKRTSSLHQTKGVDSCLKFSLSNDDPLLVKSEYLDNIPLQLACENGIVDMRTGELRPGRPSDYITKLCPVEWKGLDAPCPLWEQMLYEVLGEKKEVVHYLHKLVGYAMGGKVMEKLFVILIGEDGDSGKTTIFETLFEIVSGYASPMQVEMLLEQGGAAKNPDGPSPTTMDMKGLRMMWASEPGEGRRFSVDRIKLMSGSDTLKGRNPWDSAMTTFKPTHTLFLLTNHKMRAPASDQAFWSRVRLLECPYSFVSNPKKPHERKKIGDLGDRIVAEEGPGVLAWIVRGYQLYLKEGLDPPDAVLAATERYQREEDVIAEYIEACLDVTNDEFVYELQSDAYAIFHGWYSLNYGKRDLPTAIKFGKMIARKLDKRRVGGETRIYGVAIREVARKFKNGP